MINWYSVGFGSLWILGLGLVTASLSFANYLACQEKKRFRQVLEMPNFRIITDLGLLTFCLGLTGVASAIWERIIWIALAFIIAFHTWQVRKKIIV